MLGSRVAIVLLSLTVIAHAKPASDPKVAEARQRYESGLAHFNLREYPAAIADFEAGYRRKPDPVFLYNLGQAHRLAQNSEQALYFYRAYLRTSEDAANRREVEERMATLEKLIAEQRTLQKPPDQTIAPGERAPPATVSTPPPENKPAVVEAPPRATSTPPPPVYKRWWFWTIIGGVVVAGTAVGLAVGLTQSSGGSFNANLGTVGPGALTVRF